MFAALVHHCRDGGGWYRNHHQLYRMVDVADGPIGLEPLNRLMLRIHGIDFAREPAGPDIAQYLGAD